MQLAKMCERADPDENHPPQKLVQNIKDNKDNETAGNSNIEGEMDSWEQFFGSSTDLMPSIMDAMDALFEPNKEDAKRSFQAGHFPNLSPNVAKILANLPLDEDLDTSSTTTTSTTGDEMNFGVGNKRHSMRVRQSVFYTSLTPKQKQQFQQAAKSKSNESLDIISPNVQKMLSNLPDNELVLVSSASVPCEETNNNYVSDAEVGDVCETDNNNFGGKPLGNYMQKSSGIASRMPVGRQYMGEYLQIPSASTNSTLSSEVSRPVSMTSLGSCSSSSSSGLHQQGSAYLASAESLDSDNEPTGSQGSADSGIAESTTMGADMRVLHEVLDTEAIYVDDLHQVIKGYLEPWRNDPDCPLHEYLPHLFSNLEAIHDFNSQFLYHLRSVNLDATQIANMFLQHDSGFSIYTEYCTNYPRTMNILTELTRDEDMAKLFRERQQALHHALPLGSYLLKPVQRILKYHLFLQRLSKQCEDEHKCAVDLALATMTAVATHINTMKRKHEHAVRVQEIQAQLYGWNGDALTALGELIAEGTFRVGGARGRRHVFLFDKLIMMAKSKPDGALGYKAHIMCSNLMLVEQVRGEPLSFHILPFDNPRNQYTLRARSTQHKREWTLQIKRVILENYNAVIPNHARQLVMQLGQDVQEYTEECDKSSPVKQHTTPQYLERRGRLRKTRDFSSTRRATSQDRAFPSLGKWRRQSDPSGCQHQQYNKNMKKSPKAKKPDSSVFYTDLSDSENCGASMDSLNVIQEQEQRTFDNNVQTAKDTIAKVVSDLLMTHEDFHKVLNKQRRNMKGSHSYYKENWKKDEETLPNKSDSLPRSFQLYDENNHEILNDGQTCQRLTSLTSNENDCSITSQSYSESTISLQEEDCDHDDEEDYPEHKIYRKSTVRFSLLQRFRAILSEDGKVKLPVYKQGSKSMGAKIANPEYADPHKVILIASETSRTAPEVPLAMDGFELRLNSNEMTFSEAEVMKELDKRLSQPTNTSQTPISPLSSSSPVQTSYANTKTVTNGSSHNQNLSSNGNSRVGSSDSSYYESLLDKRLTEEESKIEKSDSFRSTSDDTKPTVMKKPEIKRPTKAPPPIPAKPKFLLKPLPNNNERTERNGPIVNNCGLESNQKGWVKTIIGRFE